MLFIVRADDSQDKDLPLLLLFQLPIVPLPSFQKPQINAVCKCKPLKDEESPETKAEYLTHLHSLITYLIANLRTA